MHNDSYFGSESRSDKRQTNRDLAWTFLASLAGNSRLASAFIITLLVGILSSATAQKAALCAVIGAAALIAVHVSRRRGALAAAPRTGGAAEAPQRCSSTLLLRTITHFSRIEQLIKRPQGVAASQGRL